jgi:putative transposase
VCIVGPREKRTTGHGENSCDQLKAERPNQVWTWDFLFDRTTQGQSLKWFSIVDECTRQWITLDVGRKITSEDVTDRLATLFVMDGVPSCIRSDNGPEFVSQAIQRWLASLDVRTLYVDPGSPWRNGYVESFHSRLRDELLNVEQFDSARHARAHASAGGLQRVSAARIPRRPHPQRVSTPTYHPLPKPYSHNPWAGNGGIPTPQPSFSPRLVLILTAETTEVTENRGARRSPASQVPPSGERERTVYRVMHTRASRSANSAAAEACR